MPKWKVEFVIQDEYPSRYYLYFFDTYDAVLDFLHCRVNDNMSYVEIEHLDGVSFPIREECE